MSVWDRENLSLNVFLKENVWKGKSIMQSVLNEISKLHTGAPLTIDRHNSNPYCLVVRENDGTKTGYYFSTPIYNRNTYKLIDMRFQSDGNTICLTGSNANITLSHKLFMENAEGSVSVRLPHKCIRVSSREIRSGP